MKKRIPVLGIVFALCILSCGDGHYSTGVVTIYNQSDYDATDILLELIPVGRAGRDDYTLTELKKGESYTFNVEWLGYRGGTNSTIEYTLDGKVIGVESEEGAWFDEAGNHYYSPQYLNDGSKAYIYIKNESYELKIDGGGYVPKEPPRVE